MAETPPPDATAPGQTDDRVVIKKYANRRLYNTESSSYVTLEHLSEMVKDGVNFVVYDAKTNEDITRQVLTQIIFEAENSEQNLLPIQFLRQLIRLYGGQMQALAPSYLEMSLDAFVRQQEQLRERWAGALAKPQGLVGFEDHVRQNMALFESAGLGRRRGWRRRRSETAARRHAAADREAGREETLSGELELGLERRGRGGAAVEAALQGVHPKALERGGVLRRLHPLRYGRNSQVAGEPDQGLDEGDPARIGA